MRKEIFTVTGCWKINKGSIAISGERQEKHFYDIGTPLVIIRPDGTKIKTEVSETEKFVTVSGNKKEAILIIGFTKEDVPIGSEVFLIE